jgi:hypothetical protein
MEYDLKPGIGKSWAKKGLDPAQTQQNRGPARPRPGRKKVAQPGADTGEKSGSGENSGPGKNSCSAEKLIKTKIMARAEN